MTSLPHLRVAVALALALVASAAGPAAADVGALTPAGCIDDDETGPDACPLSTDGLNAATSVAVSPDGKSVYATSQTDSALVRFDRAPDGVLTPAGCVDDTDAGADTCGQNTHGLNNAFAVAVSPDGKSVYVAARADSAVVRFNRAADGALTAAGCVKDNDIVSTDCTQTADGLQGARSVAVSSDGASVYVASESDDAVVRLDRAADGSIAPAGCIDDNDAGQGPDGCATSTDGLNGATSVALSPAGNSLYVASQSDAAVVRFNRSATGALTAQDCVEDNDSGPDTCAKDADGMLNLRSVTVSPDGKSVYSVSRDDDALARFDRAADGALTPAGCVDDNDSLAGQGPDTCAQEADGLDGAFTAAVTADGASVYVVSETDSALVRLDRGADGSLTPRGCVDDNDTGVDTCTQDTDGLGALRGVAASPDGASIYTSTFGDSAVARFDRELPPAPPPPAPPTPAPPGGEDIPDGGTPPPGGGGGTGLLPGACANAKQGTDAADNLVGTTAGDRILALAGDDAVTALSGADCVLGGLGVDRLNGDDGDDRLEGERGRDVLSGGTGNDALLGGADADRLLGGSGRDSLTGGAGNDNIDGAAGPNRVSAGAGNDNIAAANGRRETINCGAGRDKVRADATDRLRSCEVVRRLGRRR